MKIPFQELYQLSKKAILKYGYSEEEAQIILDMLMYAQMRGNDQGIVKLIIIVPKVVGQLRLCFLVQVSHFPESGAAVCSIFPTRRQM